MQLLFEMFSNTMNI